MFDTHTIIKTGSVNHSVTFNSIAGTLVKSSEKSKIVKFHENSPMSTMVFDINTPHIYKEDRYPYEKKEVVVLQVMLCSGGNFLVEYLDVVKEE